MDIGLDGGRPPNLVTKTGPLFLSGLFQWGLFGVLCTQFPNGVCFLLVVYISAFPHDTLRNKLFIYSILVLVISQIIILTKLHFDIFASGFGDPKKYDETGTIWFSVPLMTGVVACLAQVFYAMRLFLLSKSYLVPAFVCALAVIQAGGAISCAIVLKEAHYFSRVPQPALSIASGIWTGGSALCDIVIAFYMTRYLWKRRNVGTPTTQLIVKRIIRMVLETGTVTAVVAVSFFALTMLPNHASYYQVPASILALLYSNSMLALLNSRINLDSCRTSDAERPPQIESHVTTLRFQKSPVVSQITGLTSLAPSHRGHTVARHQSFVTEDSRRTSAATKGREGYMYCIEERSMRSNRVRDGVLLISSS